MFVAWLKGSRLTAGDLIFVLSVGGGSLESNISPNLVRALQYAKEIGSTVCGIVGRDGGYTARVADACVLVPTVNPQHITPHAEAFQAVVWHLLVSHPAIKAGAPRSGKPPRRSGRRAEGRRQKAEDRRLKVEGEQPWILACVLSALGSQPSALRSGPSAPGRVPRSRWGTREDVRAKWGPSSPSERCR